MHKASLRGPIGGDLRSVRIPVLRIAMAVRLLAPRHQHHCRLREAVLFRFLKQAVLMMGMAVLLGMPDRAMGLHRPNLEGEPKAQVWLISTHQADWQTDLSEAFSIIRYWRLGSSAQWKATDQEAFFADLAFPMPTVIYIHGNWTQLDTAIQQAWTISGPLWQAAGQRRFRLVVWCWPAERTSARLLTDLRFKAGRSDVEAYLLARHLQRMACSEPILLVGYSFGARVITGALHLLGGGRLMGRSLLSEAGDSEPSCWGSRKGLSAEAGRSGPTRLPAGFGQDNRVGQAAHSLPRRQVGLPAGGQTENSSHRTGRFRGILIAAAIGNDWLLPGGRHQQALSQLEKLLVTVNRADPALRWYPRLEPGHSPALGWAGPPGGTGLHQQTPSTKETGPQEVTGPKNATQPTDATQPPVETGPKDRPGPKEGIVPTDQTGSKNGPTPQGKIDARHDRRVDSFPSRLGFGSSHAKIEVLWITCSVGNQHDWRLYLQTPELQGRLPRYLFDPP